MSRTVRAMRSCLQITLLILQLKFTFSDGSHCYCVKQEFGDLHSPIHIEAVKLNGEHVYFIAEQTGLVQKYEPNAGNRLTPYIDVQDRIVVENKFFEERGLLGFALHPDFANNSRIFLYTIREMNEVYYAVISEIRDQRMDQETIILLIQQSTDRRNGGQLLFGRDGYLYVFVGDGGTPEDGDNEAQNGDSFLGKVLRINVNQTTVVDNKLQYYTVPDDNPKVPGWRPEVYAIGGRNMWRCSVDKGDAQGRIFCGDLGSKYSEELNIIEKGGNYGWNIKEGSKCLKADNCSVQGEVLPIQVFNRDDSNITAIVGGPLYRGSVFSNLYGRLVFGDFSSGDVYSLEENNNDTWSPHTFPQCPASVCGCDVRDIRRTHLLSIAETFNGELFLLMTDELNPHIPRGALLSLHAPQSKSMVTCDSTMCRLDVYFMLSFLILCRIM